MRSYSRPSSLEWGKTRITPLKTESGVDLDESDVDGRRRVGYVGIRRGWEVPTTVASDGPSDVRG